MINTKFKNIEFFLNILLWYIFTLISAIYTKLYLNKTNESFTFTLITFSYGFVLNFFTLKKSILKDTTENLKKYFYLSIFNIGSILLTNISINQTSVSFIYMVKASEPIFVLFLSCVLLGHKYDNRIIATLIQICIGVTLTIIGNVKFSIYGLICIFFANLSTASRSVFYKLSTSNDDDQSTHSKKTSLYSFYLNISFFSFIMTFPFYFVNLIIRVYFSFLQNRKYKTGFSFSKIILNVDLSNHNEEFYEIVKYLLIGTFLNFLYNLFSFKILDNVTSITHSIINIMKRMFVVFGSMIFFSSKITSMQYFGIFLADSGCLIYSYFKATTQVKISNISNKKINFIRKMVFTVLIFIMLSTFIHENYGIDSTKSIQNRNRLKCIEKIKENIISSFKKIIPPGRDAILLDIPDHPNYGDSLIW